MSGRASPKPGPALPPTPVTPAPRLSGRGPCLQCPRRKCAHCESCVQQFGVVVSECGLSRMAAGARWHRGLLESALSGQRSESASPRPPLLPSLKASPQYGLGSHIFSGWERMHVPTWLPEAWSSLLSGCQPDFTASLLRCPRVG